MRYPKERRAVTRGNILEAASRLFRARGVANTGVDAVMAELGMSAGGFYAHFKSKQELVTEALLHSCQETREKLGAVPAERGMEGILRRYLSPAHRDECAEGCPFVALIGELTHGQAASPEFVQREVEPYLALLQERLDETPEAREKAWGLLALMIGGLALSRALNGTDSSHEVLLATRRLGKEMAER